VETEVWSSEGQRCPTDARSTQRCSSKKALTPAEKGSLVTHLIM